jgi:WD40 repeat protein
LEEGSVATLKGHAEEVEAVAVTPGGHQVISGGGHLVATGDCTLKVWDLRFSASDDQELAHSGWVTTLAATPDGRVAVSGSSNGRLRAWDPGTGAALDHYLGHAGDWVHAVSIAADSRRVVSAQRNNLKLWRLAPKTVPWDYPYYEAELQGHDGDVSDVAITPDGRAVSGSRDGTIRVWDLSAGREMRAIEVHGDEVTAVAVAANGHHIIAAGGGIVAIWDIDTGEQVGVLGEDSLVTRLRVSRDGRLAVSVAFSRQIKLWDLGHQAKTGVLSGHSDYVRDVAFSATERSLVSVSDDETVKIWDLGTGMVTASFICEGPLFACAVAPDGTILAGEKSGRLHFLRLHRAAQW